MRRFLRQCDSPLLLTVQFAGNASKKLQNYSNSFIRITPLQQFLQNCRNPSHASGCEAKIGENDALLQESYHVAPERPKIPASIRLLRKKF